MRKSVLAALVLLPVCVGACSGNEEARVVLEKRRAELLATTVERDAFWKQVERKGKALSAKKLEDQAIAEAAARIPVAEQRTLQAETATAEARSVNDQADEVLSNAQQRRDELRAEVQALDQKLARWRVAAAKEPQ